MLKDYGMSVNRVVFLFGPGTYECQEQGDLDVCQCPGKLYGHCFVQGGGAKDPHAVPGGCGGCHGGGVIDGSAREYAESVAGHCVKSKHLPKGREQDCCQHVKEEDDGDCLRNLFIVSVNDRGSGRNGGTTADGGTNAHQGGYLRWNIHGFM